MLFVARGIALVFGNRRYWPFVAKPMLASTVIFFAIIVVGYTLLVPWGSARLEHLGLNGPISEATVRIAYLVLWWFLAGIVFVTMAGLLSSVLWDRLSEREVDPTPPNLSTNFKEWLLDALPRTGFACLIFCGTTCFFWLLPVGIVLASWLCLYDYTASAYLRRGVSFPRQVTRVMKSKGWPTFALTCGALTLLPFINVLLLPALVAGGTLMVAEAERAGNRNLLKE